MQGQTFTTWDLLRLAVRKTGATEAQPLILGNVEVWIDTESPWEGSVSYSPATSQWRMPEFQAALTAVLQS